jgi:sodium-dependent dicarboxylate transporter 2/3/5
VIGVPVVIVLYLFLFYYLNKFCPSGTRELEGSGELIARERREIGPLTKGQISTLIAFAVTVLMWVVPGLIACSAASSRSCTRR